MLILQPQPEASASDADVEQARGTVTGSHQAYPQDQRQDSNEDSDDERITLHPRPHSIQTMLAFASVRATVDGTKL